jgi:sugar lactone lactonase YvrE
MRKIIIGLIVAIFLSSCSSSLVSIKEIKTSSLKDFNSAQFIQGMKGAENMYLVPNSSAVYVTDLSGTIYLLDENDDGRIRIKKSLKIGKSAMGIVQGKDGYLYVNASEYDMDGWLEYGGEVYRVDTELKSYVKITDKFKGINGLSIDDNGNLYFAIGDLNFSSPHGAIYKMTYNEKLKQYSKPKLFLDKLGSANGMFYSKTHNSIFFTGTFSKVSMVNLQTKKVTEVFGKTKTVEGFDDLCMDSNGRIWAADSADEVLKMYNPQNQKLIRFHIKELGFASSCRTRFKGEEEFIYITERQIDKLNDGRGLIILSISELLKN